MPPNADGSYPAGTPMAHYSSISNTCVDCHMGEDADHGFEPSVDNCQQCHPGATDFDINGLQTEIMALADSLGAKLVAAGLIDEATAEGEPIVTQAPEAQARAMWNWITVFQEDRSLGVHNPAYARALLEAGIAALP